MSDNEGDELGPRGNEWEVVTLTESTYNAAPSPQHGVLDSDAETHHVMLMSGNFGSSPSKHENLSPEPEKEKSGKSYSKPEENLNIEGLISDEFAEVPNFDGKDNDISYYSSTFGNVQPSNLMEKEPSVYNTSMYNTEEGSVIDKPFESQESVQNNNEEDTHNGPSNLPCEAWWRKHADSLYGHAKNANPFWSIVVVAAVVGLVVIGHRLQRNKPQVFRLKSQLGIDDKRSGWTLGPVTRLKDVNLSGQHSPYIQMSSFAEH